MRSDCREVTCKPDRSSGRNRNGSSMCPARGSHYDLDLLVERHQCLHQAFKRDILQLEAPDLGHLWLRHSSDVSGLDLA